MLLLNLWIRKMSDFSKIVTSQENNVLGPIDDNLTSTSRLVTSTLHPSPSNLQLKGRCAFGNYSKQLLTYD